MAEAAIPRKKRKFRKPADLASRHVYTPEEVKYGRVFDPDPYREALPWSYKRGRPYRFGKALLDYYTDFLERLESLGD